MIKNYPDYYRSLLAIQDKLIYELPGPMKSLGHLHNETTAGGALDTEVKELIALGIAITVRCDGCISYHVHDALQAGASRK
jgi:AhpD family alkylhydroperoxidase